jgi:hypothetical protein
MASHKRGITAINNFINPFVEQALKTSSAEKVTGPHDTYAFLNTLVEFTDDREMLPDQIAAVLIARRDTTAANLS